MVNQIPLLDGAEASACGLVHGVSNKVVWGSFGLHVAKSSDSDMHSWTPHFDVRDSDQLAPFFQSQTHRLWEARQEQSDEDLVEEEAKKRKRHLATRSSLLPAKVRLGHIIVVVHIRAAPSSLPLPTLSKVREVDLTCCCRV
jgi:ribosomal protein RSM22 (predicted rRNA methylase)